MGTGEPGATDRKPRVLFHEFQFQSLSRPWRYGPRGPNSMPLIYFPSNGSGFADAVNPWDTNDSGTIGHELFEQSVARPELIVQNVFMEGSLDGIISLKKAASAVQHVHMDMLGFLQGWQHWAFASALNSSPPYELIFLASQRFASKALVDLYTETFRTFNHDRAIMKVRHRYRKRHKK